MNFVLTSYLAAVKITTDVLCSAAARRIYGVTDNGLAGGGLKIYEAQSIYKLSTKKVEEGDNSGERILKLPKLHCLVSNRAKLGKELRSTKAFSAINRQCGMIFHAYFEQVPA